MSHRDFLMVDLSYAVARVLNYVLDPGEGAPHLTMQFLGLLDAAIRAASPFRPVFVIA